MSSLSHLPDDILLHVLALFDACDLAHLQQVHPRLHAFKTSWVSFLRKTLLCEVCSVDGFKFPCCKYEKRSALIPPMAIPVSETTPKVKIDCSTQTISFPSRPVKDESEREVTMKMLLRNVTQVLEEVHIGKTPRLLVPAQTQSQHCCPMYCMIQPTFGVEVSDGTENSAHTTQFPANHPTHACQKSTSRPPRLWQSANYAYREASSDFSVSANIKMVFNIFVLIVGRDVSKRKEIVSKTFADSLGVNHKLMQNSEHSFTAESPSK